MAYPLFTILAFLAFGIGCLARGAWLVFGEGGFFLFVGIIMVLAALLISYGCYLKEQE